MKLTELKVIDFLNEVDSSSPAPGGGSVAALTSSLGISLSRMVSHLTINRKKYLELDESLRNEYENNFNALANLKEELLPLVEKDTIAFNQIMNAFKLPKATEEDKLKRTEAIQKATVEAIKVPNEIAKLSHNALQIIKHMMKYGNNNAITDIGVGVLLLYAGLEGALLNVKINLGSIRDKNVVMLYQELSNELLKQGKKLRDEILKYVYEQL